VDRLGGGAVPDSVDAVVLVALGAAEARALVDALVGALADGERGSHAPVIPGAEVADFQLAGVDHREGGGLDTADGGDVAGAGAEHPLRQRTGPVDADEPVALAAAAGGLLEAGHPLAIAEVAEGLADALGGHRLHPRALYREAALRELVEVGEDELALAPGVAGVHDLIHVLAAEELLHGGEPLLRVLNWLQAEFLRDDRQGLEPPEAVLLLVDVLRHLQLDHVADGVGDDVLVVLVVVPLLGDLTEGAREVRRDGRLLGDDK
jgi:hypothetical protein